ncbi:MAG: hypothetical protein WAK91_16675 [Candidatus Acidiferrales bacterium]|jgi:hypothetical protein
MRVLVSFLLALGLAASPAMAGDDTKKVSDDTAKTAPAKTASDSNKNASTESTPAVEVELQQMRDLLKAQSDQLEQQRAALQLEQQKVQALEERLSAAPPNASAPATGAVAATSVDPQTGHAMASATLAAPTAPIGPQSGISADSVQKGPESISYKGISITPGGFVAAETAYRQRATGSDINTPFNSIPYPGVALGHLAENAFTARQSRLSLLAQGKVGTAKLTGYYEADWLGTGVTSNNRQSNSYVFRQRVLFGQVKFDNGWSVTGGQQWSLATEDRKGIDNRQEIQPMTIDPQYSVGYTWARQYGFRVVKSFGDKFALAVSVEAPQATIGGRGFSLVTTTNQGTAAVTTTGNTFIDSPGSGGGLYNFSDTTGYTVNKAPDVILKASADPGWGHYEFYGIISEFRSRVYPCGVVGTNANDTDPPMTTTTIPCPVDGSTTPSSLGVFDDSRTGGGLGFALRVPVGTKKVEFALQGAGGDGIGRYGSAQLPDMTFRGDGTVALIRTAHGLGELEFHVTPKFDLYAYYGAEYAWRAQYHGYDSVAIVKTPAIPATSTSTAIPATTTTTIKLNQIGGYGSVFANDSGCSTEAPPTNQLTPSGGGTCAGDTRLISEATLGFWHKIYQGPMGGLRWGLQYSYLSRTGWSGNNNVAGATSGISPRAVDNMLLTSFRYYIP